MAFFSEIKKALKIAKKIKEIKNYFDKNVIDKQLQDDIAEIKKIFERMGNRIEVFKGLWELIFK